jgi:hypothetical protein
MLGPLGLRIFQACTADIADLGEEHGHCVLRVVGKGSNVVLVPLPPAVGRAIDRAVDGRTTGPLLRNTRRARMDRHAATRPLRRRAEAAGARLPRMHRKIASHGSLNTTQRYLHPVGDSIAAAGDALSAHLAAGWSTSGPRLRTASQVTAGADLPRPGR